MNEIKSNRILSIDVLRGLVMLIMALDHVRDFFHVHGMDIDPLDLTTTTPFLFFTRWITHFCAPIFVFLSGISASLAMRHNSSGGFLIKRGLWLILVEVTVITLGLTLNPLFNVIILQVIWAIGFSMVLLGLLSRSPRPVIFAIGMVIVLGHDALNYLALPPDGVEGTLWKLFFTSRAAFVPIGSTHFVAILYAGIPWTGVMFLGYGIGGMFEPAYDAGKRRKVLLLVGVAAFLFFVILRFTNIYGDPSPWVNQERPFYTFLSFLNVSKYPPSLLYCSITLSAGLIFLSLTETSVTRIAKVLTEYGRVPFFYYILHFYLIRFVGIIFFFVSGYTVKDIINPQFPFLFRPFAFGFSLPVVYLIWVCIIGLLYLPCVWYWGYKNRNREKWWTKYV